MAALNDVKRRIESVKNTRKITYAMKIVSAAKLKKSQQYVSQAREYRLEINQLLNDVMAEAESVEVTDPLLEKRPVKVLTLLIIGGSRGLCGGYNTNINKKVVAYVNERLVADPNLQVNAIILGKKPAEFFRRTKRKFTKSYEDLGDDPRQWPIKEVADLLVSDYKTGKSDEIVLFYTKFRSAISVNVTSETLLPMTAESLNIVKDSQAQLGLCKFEPSPLEVFSALLPRVILSNITQACLDSKASEQGCRMTAMDAATKNAKDLSTKLTLYYNRIRQQKITSELLDIVGGAEAIS